MEITNKKSYSSILNGNGISLGNSIDLVNLVSPSSIELKFQEKISLNFDQVCKNINDSFAIFSKKIGGVDVDIKVQCSNLIEFRKLSFDNIEVFANDEKLDSERFLLIFFQKNDSGNYSDGFINLNKQLNEKRNDAFEEVKKVRNDVSQQKNQEIDNKRNQILINDIQYINTDTNLKDRTQQRLNS